MLFFTDEKVSPQGTVNKEDLKKWAKNILIFASPLLILFLTQLQAGKSLQEALPLVYGALIQAIIDLLRKFNDGKK